jgi:exopolysaccharide biosynthesis polyprenyl glycosylphosphotransferase
VTPRLTDRRRRQWRRGAVSRIADAVTIMAAWAVALAAPGGTPGDLRGHRASLALALIAAAASLVLQERRRVHQARPGLSQVDRTSRTVASLLGGTAVVALVAAVTEVHVGAGDLAAGLGLATVATFVVRAHLALWRQRRPGPSLAERVAVVGAGEEARDLTTLIAEHADADFELVGVIGEQRVAERCGLDELWLGPTEDVLATLERHRVDAVVLTATGFRGPLFHRLSRQMLGAGYEVHVSNGVTRLHSGRITVRNLVHEPLISVSGTPTPAWQWRCKRAVDVAVAATALVLASPVMAVAAVAILVESGRPVLFRQKRVGAGGELFTMTKFRSMTLDAEDRRDELEARNERTGPLFKMTRDPRVTRVGRVIRDTSIDELPQLLDVLRGDMSLVGPRPALPEEEAHFDRELRGRFDVPPGITGLWQVEARSNASFNAYRRLDLHYVENWTLWLDLRILLATAHQVLVSAATLPARRLLGVGAGPGDPAAELAAAPDQGSARVVIDLRARHPVRARRPEGDSDGPVLGAAGD